MTNDDFPTTPYNYCDYRCETCEFKDHCKVYASELDEGFEAKDPFGMVSENLHETIDMLKEYLKENDIDFSMEDEDDDDYYEQMREEVERTEVMRLANQYMDKIMAFQEEYNERYFIPPVLSEAFSDLDWYKTIIPVKIQRTLVSLCQFIDTEEEFPLEDAYFTSRVVYKSLWKSLAAVEEIMEILSDYQDTFVELENLLITIRNKFKHEFPFEIFIELLRFYQIEKKKKKK